MRNGDWMETYTGKRIYPLDPRTEDICIEDIAHGLSNICRYNGHSKFFFSVAHHSLNCCAYAKRVGLSKRMQYLCLLHDAAEAYVGDVVRPLKPYIPLFEEMEKRIQQVIYIALGIKPPSKNEEATVSMIDTKQLVTEVAILMPFKQWGKWTEGFEPDTKTIISEASIGIVEADFLSALRRYLKEAQNERLPDIPTKEPACICGSGCTCGDGCTCTDKAKP